MAKDVFTYIIGGKAGQGTKKAGIVAANFFAEYNRDVFQMNDYPSLVRGGHNFSVVSTSIGRIYSHYMKADLAVVLDQRSCDIHKAHLKEKGILVFNSDNTHGDGIGIPITTEAKKYSDPELISGVAGIAVLAATISAAPQKLEDIIKKEYKGSMEENLRFAQAIFTIANEKIKDKSALQQGRQKKTILAGSETIALGAIAGGLDLYFSYPMTPSTPVLHYLASHGRDFGVITIQPEHEIAVANMAIGAAFTGARSMVGTSGGGFCLMQEAFSLAGMVEAPVLFLLGQRPGPSTGVPTYTEQGELRFSMTPGQGEFPRVVASPGSVTEAFYLTAELLSLLWRFQTPGILLTEKHMTESSMSVEIDPEKAPWAEPIVHTLGEYYRYRDTDDGVSPLLFPPSKSLIKWNSYEHDEQGLTTESAEGIKKMHEKRRRKHDSLVAFLQTKHTVNVYGNGEPLIFTFGSTTMSVLEAIDAGDITATVVQPIYLEPFPTWELERYQHHRCIVVEQNSTGQLESLLKEKARLTIQHSIRQYDGRPFDPMILAQMIKEAI